MKIKYLTFASVALVSSSVFAEVAVIVHPSNANAIDANAIAKIYTGKMKSYDDGNKIIAIAQDAGNPITDEFNEKALKKSSSQLKAYWSKLVFTGKGTPPKEVSNDAEVISLVASNPNTIGFISSSAADGTVKVVQTF